MSSTRAFVGLSILSIAALSGSTAFLASTLAEPPAKSVGTRNQQAAVSVVVRDGNALTKIIVNNSTGPQRSALGSNAKLVRQYEAFSVLSVPAAQAARLANTEGVSVREDFDSIFLRRAPIDTRLGARGADPLKAGAQLMANGKAVSNNMAIVQFPGPVMPEQLTALTNLGVEVVHYIPENGFFVWLNTPDARAALTRNTGQGALLQFSDDFTTSDALSPELDALIQRGGMVDVTVQTYNHRQAEVQGLVGAGNATVAEIVALSNNVIRPPDVQTSSQYTNVTLSVPAASLLAIASMPGVVNVEPYSAPVRLSERQDQVIAGNLNGAGTQPSGAGYLGWLQSRGFPTSPASYPNVSVVDDGIDNGSASPLDPVFYVAGKNAATGNLRLVNNGNACSDATADGQAGHGHLNTSIVGGYDAGNGPLDVTYLRAMGVSPWGRISGWKIFTNAGGFSLSKVGNTIAGLCNAHTTSAVPSDISSNSWGNTSGNTYNSDAQAYDIAARKSNTSGTNNYSILYVFAAGNSGSGANTVHPPGTAKNILVVGATEDTDNSGTDGCGTTATQADNIQQMATFSSRGPCSDSRVKPDIVAPGTHVAGSASRDPTYDGTGVCDKYWPSAGQTVYARSSGTSHSTPATAGFASLTWNYINRTYGITRPSPALMKAYIVNHARYLTATGGNLPSNSQGYGFLNGDLSFKNPVPRVVDDQSTIFTAAGQSKTYTGVIASLTEPLRVTVAWTDYRGNTSGNAYVNNLDLTVTVGGNTYKGNVFTNSASVTGGSADVRNNIESVFLPAGVSGPITITVTGTAISQNAVTGSGFAVSQDFAVVAYNVNTTGVALAGPGPNTITDTLGTGNDNGSGVIDPGENSIGLTIPIKNSGINSATNVNATIVSNTATATVTAAAGSYGTLAGGATGNNGAPYMLSIDSGHPCGAPISLTVNVTSDQGPFSFNVSLPTGTQAATGAPQPFWFFGPAAAIPDNSGAGVNTNFSVSGIGKVGQIQFTIAGNSCDTTVGSTNVGLDHSWAGDVTMTLISPSGTSVNLIYRAGGKGVNFCNTTFSDSGTTSIQNTTTVNAPYSGTWAPYEPLSKFIGEPADGPWTFIVRDAAAGNTGNIRQAALYVSPAGAFTCTAPAIPAPTCKPNLVTASGCLGSPDLLSFLTLYFTNYDGFGSGVPASAVLPFPFASGPMYAVPCSGAQLSAVPPVVLPEGLKADYDGDCQIASPDLLIYLNDYFNPAPACFTGC